MRLFVCFATPPRVLESELGIYVSKVKQMPGNQMTLLFFSISYYFGVKSVKNLIDQSGGSTDVM